MMTALETLQQIAREPAQVAHAYKAQGKPVVGYRCLFVPEEIIWAAGMLPYPLYGTPEPVGLADSYFQSCNCEFVRNVFDHALAGDYAFVDSLVLSNTCDAVRRLYDIWNAYLDGPPAYMLNNPQKLLTDDNRAYFLEELKRFKTHMERLADTTISDDKLTEAIGLYNETRTLLKSVYSLRAQPQPPLTGQEALEICLAVTVMPKDQANPLLRKLLAELEKREPPELDGPRILVTGSIIDHPALIELIEQQEALVVADDLCTTSRYFWHQVELGDDSPLEAIYRQLNQRCLCACMHPVQARLEHLLGLVDQFEVEAVVNFNVKYCHAFLYEAPLFRKALEQRDVPTLVLEVGHDLSGHGQLRTRLQAFIEMIEF